MPETPDVIVLCGGKGLRLRSVTSGPKAMAEVAGRPFLEVLFQQLRHNGFRRAVLAVGYGADVIREHFGSECSGLTLVYSVEESPLGTGGAARKAAGQAETEMVLVMNGDSYTGADLKAFIRDEAVRRADASVLVVPVDGRNDCGTVTIDGQGRLLGFEEKSGGAGSGHINAGIYLIRREMLCALPEGERSMEREVIPAWVAEGRNVRGFEFDGTCVDIGTPERLTSAQDLLEGVESGEAVAGRER